MRILSIKCPWSPLLLPALTLCSCYRHSLWEMQIYVALRLIIISVHTCWTVSPSINHHSHLSHLYHACFLCPLISDPYLWWICLNVSLPYIAIHGVPQGGPLLLGMALIPWQGTSRASWSISRPAPTTSPLAIIIAHPLGSNPTQTN